MSIESWKTRRKRRRVKNGQLEKYGKLTDGGHESSSAQKINRDNRIIHWWLCFSSSRGHEAGRVCEGGPGVEEPPSPEADPAVGHVLQRRAGLHRDRAHEQRKPQVLPRLWVIWIHRLCNALRGDSKESENRNFSWVWEFQPSPLN